MIVKVQLSLWTSMDATGNRDRMALIYNEGEDFLVETLASSFPGLLETMGDRQRAFFEAELDWYVDGRCVINVSSKSSTNQIVKHEQNCSCKKVLKFKEMVPDQDW